MAEVHRRSLWQVVGIYGVASWIVYGVEGARRSLARLAAEPTF